MDCWKIDRFFSFKFVSESHFQIRQPFKGNSLSSGGRLLWCEMLLNEVHWLFGAGTQFLFTSIFLRSLRRRNERNEQTDESRSENVVWVKM